MDSAPGRPPGGGDHHTRGADPDVVRIRPSRFRLGRLLLLPVVTELVTGHDRRVHVFLDGLTGDDHLGHVLAAGDRKSTRLNSSYVAISYAVFCLKKKTKQPQ